MFLETSLVSIMTIIRVLDPVCTYYYWHVVDLFDIRTATVNKVKV